MLYTEQSLNIDGAFLTKYDPTFINLFMNKKSQNENEQYELYDMYILQNLRMIAGLRNSRKRKHTTVYFKHKKNKIDLETSKLYLPVIQE